MRDLFKFFRLSYQEKLFFIKAFYTIGYFRLLLRKRELQALFTSVSSRSRKLLKHPESSTIPPARLARLIHIANGLVPLSTCLAQCLAGKQLLAEKGYKTTLHIGVNNQIQSGFEAHAWLSMNGNILLGDISNLHQYHELSSPSSLDEP